MKTYSTQVGILGAGPAGLLLAHLLQKAGIDSIVIDRRSREDIEKTIRAGIVEAPFAEVLAKSGVSDRIYREGQRHEGIEFHFSGRSHRFDFTDLVGKAVHLYPQHEVLIDLIAARFRDGNPPHFEHDAIGIKEENSIRPSIVGSGPNGEEFELKADYIVGADGSGSITRIPVTGSKTGGYFREYPFAWYGILVDAPPSSEELIYSRSEDGFVLISTRDEKVQRMYFQCDPDMPVGAVNDEQIWQKLQAGVSNRDLVRGDIFQKDVLRFRSFVANSLKKGNIFLVGDAAHTVPPTGAKGMNLAISDVLWLNQALREFYRSGSETLLESYEVDALKRIWRAQHYSFWMTSMLHISPESTEFDNRRSLGELESLTRSRFSQQALAEGYTGWEYEAQDWL